MGETMRYQSSEIGAVGRDAFLKESRLRVAGSGSDCEETLGLETVTTSRNGGGVRGPSARPRAAPRRPAPPRPSAG
ncbi:hypothetical protein EYF80_002868 [Liparis tanakae]|uniref:Uncharacterized protein n=1 Tax=Liparis tanakae TaxID=230148 RepID=A0A4Z2JBH2_9TELE|nr:hypothetical protein EYF80_002868 [Liparis tanakae]